MKEIKGKCKINLYSNPKFSSIRKLKKNSESGLLIDSDKFVLIR